MTELPCIHCKAYHSEREGCQAREEDLEQVLLSAIEMGDIIVAGVDERGEAKYALTEQGRLKVIAAREMRSK